MRFSIWARFGRKRAKTEEKRDHAEQETREWDHCGPDFLPEWVVMRVVLSLGTGTLLLVAMLKPPAIPQAGPLGQRKSTKHIGCTSSATVASKHVRHT